MVTNVGNRYVHEHVQEQIVVICLIDHCTGTKTRSLVLQNMDKYYRRCPVRKVETRMYCRTLWSLKIVSQLYGSRTMTTLRL